MQRVAATLLCLALLGPAIAQAGSRRALKQQDALSNSNGCLNDIPKCEPGACVTRNIMGVAKWACLRCRGGYEAVVDESGQDNIIQCVCPRGFYEPAANSTSCSRCPLGSFCPGGDKVEVPTSRGSLVTCGANLVTRNTGARTQADCVAPRGYAMSSPTTATPCNPSEYAPHFNRLGRCLRCQSGLQEPPNSGFNASQRESKRVVCRVPPGRYMSQGLVRICPQGFYRESFRAFDDSLAQVCVACNPGITTAGPGAGFQYMCNTVLPGYGIAAVNNVTGAASIPALPLNETANLGLPNATLCAIGYYSLNGYCAQCPGGTVTTRLGAQAIEECVVPPGYFLPASGSMTKCGGGSYREGWVMASDTRAKSCTLCGSGIASEARERDENPLAASSSLVRATSASCYIEAGQGMIAEGKNSFNGRDCPVNTYGAAGRVYGLMSAPCKPCPRNMITDLDKRNSSDACINPDGFGYASEGASQCMPGFYALKGSKKPCARCSQGRTTLDLPSAQRLDTDCFIKPGFGVASSANSTDAFAVNTAGLNASQLAALPVLECGIGYYGLGNATGAKCQPCPTGSTTEETGRSSPADCTICIPGFGRATPSSPCTICPQGSYQPGRLTSCQLCPNATFYPPVDGVGATWTSVGTTTFLGAVGEESCVPKESQLSPEAGQAFFGSAPAVQALLTTTNATSLATCLASCEATACCMVQWHADTNTCKRASLPPVGADALGFKLLYKLPPSTMGSASSIKAATAAAPEAGGVTAKTISSGIYARAAIPDANKASWLLVGTNLDQTGRTFSKADQASLWRAGSEAECKSLCDNSNVCWGFIHDGTSCLFRGGEDALKTRSFMVLPSGDVSAFNWQGASALDLAIRDTLSLAAAQSVTVTRQQVVDALNAVAAQNGGTYSPVLALQRIQQQQADDAAAAAAAAAALKAAVEEVVKLGAEKGYTIDAAFAEKVLVAQGTPYNTQAALQTIIDSMGGGGGGGSGGTVLGDLVSKLREISSDKKVLAPMWQQAVAVLLMTSPKQPDEWDVDAAFKLWWSVVSDSGVLKIVLEKMGSSGVTVQEAVNAILAVPDLWEWVQAGKLDGVVELSLERLNQQGKATQEVLLAVLRGETSSPMFASQQLVWDVVNMTFAAGAADVGVVAQQLARLREVADKVLSVLDGQNPDVSKVFSKLQEQLLWAVSMAAADSNGDWDAAVKLSIQRLPEVLEIAKALVPEVANALGSYEMSDMQAVEFVLLGMAYSRTIYKELVFAHVPVIAEGTKQLTEAANAAVGEAFSAWLAASGQVGAAGSDNIAGLVKVAQQQLQLGAEVQKKAQEVFAQEVFAASKYTAEEVNAAVVGLYRRSGYWTFGDAETAAATAWMDLARKQG